MSAESAAAPQEKLPRQIPFIIANETCERFSFYGMRNILTAFLTDQLLVASLPDEAARNAEAKSIVHTFILGVYFFPLLGGFLADRYFGKYKIILWVSIVYTIGHGLLALFETNQTGFFAGMFLIALGSGGIKPCVAAMVGDQFDEKNKHLAKKVFDAFYWSINFGSFFATLILAKVLKKQGAQLAFGIPGLLMLVAVVVFFAGRRRYVLVPPRGKDPHGFLPVLVSMLRGRAATTHPEAAVSAVRSVGRVLVVFLPVPFFFMIFDQKASTWVIQAKKMAPEVGPFTFEPSQMQVVNPLLVMLLIPLLTGVVYPLLRRRGREPSPLAKMTVGIALGGLSFVVAGLIDLPVQAGVRLSILWQLIPYMILTAGEILVSTTGLEFAYSQAPPSMKSTIMSFWNLTVAAANGVVVLLSKVTLFSGSMLFFYYAGFAFAAAVAMGLIARSYKVEDHYGARA